MTVTFDEFFESNENASVNLLTASVPITGIFYLIHINIKEIYIEEYIVNEYVVNMWNNKCTSYSIRS